MATSISGPRMAEQGKETAQVATADERRLLDNWLTIQGINLTRHANSLRSLELDLPHRVRHTSRRSTALLTVCVSNWTI